MTTQELQRMTDRSFHEHIAEVYWHIAHYKDQELAQIRSANEFKGALWPSMQRHCMKRADINRKVHTRLQAWVEKQIRLRYEIK